ncbi:hypothetical protein [Priestia megaterium]|uniref:Uncharacterized protein n=1 Tax=Priestia megaterium TaxID=1404 RepID=A0A6M6DZL9_PRIMG|nr:hypothetical protein [Priestia megaterium]QJX80050.1 hypothetical protein FDZ14_28550 [Priestia megaterium]
MKMEFNAKELENLSAEEQVKILKERLKEYETLKCSEKNCDSDLSDKGWTIYKNRKLCLSCYQKEYDKDKQPDMDLIVGHYMRQLKSVTIINDAKSKINITEQEFQHLIKPFKTDNTEKLEYMRVIIEHYITVRITQASINSLKNKHHMKPEEYEGLIKPFRLEYESKPKKVIISRTLEKQNNARLNAQYTVKTVEDSASEIENNKSDAHSIQKESQSQTQAELTKGTYSPSKQDTSYAQQTTDKSTFKEVSETPTQKRKKETPPTIKEELDKQKEIQKQSSSTDQVEEKTNLVKDPIPSPTKKQEVEEQNTNTQFVTQIDSKTVYGENSTDPSLQGDSSVNDQSLFDLDPGTPENNEYNELNQEYNSSSQDFQNIRQSSVNQADSKAGVTKEPLNFTGFPGSQL